MAYAAGAIDSDGCISIKRSTYGMRVIGDRTSASYYGTMTLSHVTPQVPEMLRAMFGGGFWKQRPQTENSRPLHKWNATCANASRAAHAILPHLRIKFRQAEAIIELAELQKTPGICRISYWFEKENPDWRDGNLIDVIEVSRRLGYKDRSIAYQAISNGTILALKTGSGGSRRVLVPEELVDLLAAAKTPGGKYLTARQFIDAQHAIYERVRTLNKVGVNGTSVNHRTGHHAPAA